MATGTGVDAADSRGFTYAASRRRRAPSVSFAMQLERVTGELNEQDWLGRVTRLVASAHSDGGFDAPFGRLLCLGIGRPGESKAARAQLALLLALASAAGIPLAEAHVYEPAFSDQDAHELARLGLGVVSKRKAHHLIDADGAPPLLYMPHCDREVLEAFFGDNWSRAALARFVLVGNHLADYSDILPEWKLARESPCVFSLSSRLTSWPLPPNDAVPTAFNNLSVQFLPRASVPAEDDAAFWALPFAAAGRVAAPAEPDGDSAASQQSDAAA
ncbi:hypothetical protein AURDEDRAFT_113753 [Auricularia subglabra TFB-10046 SS5]|nr:hypothetical protein AURDEDRAFT_113753 [Auricularia subglabra TFB-10046 SS5]